MTSLYSILLMAITLAVVLSRRTMYSILYLILLFVLMALFVFSLGVDFIGLIFIIVYVGAIATLFLFIIMMLGGETWTQDSALDVINYQLLLGSGFRSVGVWNWVYKGRWYMKHAALDIILMLTVGIVGVQAVATHGVGHLDSWLSLTQSAYTSTLFDTSYLYGIYFYNRWYLPFLLAALVLLIAMLGSIILTTRLVAIDSKPPANAPAPQPKAKKKGTMDTDLPTDRPSSISHLVQQRKFEEAWPFRVFPWQCLWFGVAYLGAGWLGAPFMTPDLLRYAYKGVCIGIYLVGAYFIERYFKRRI